MKYFFTFRDGFKGAISKDYKSFNSAVKFARERAVANNCTVEIYNYAERYSADEPLLTIKNIN